MGTAIKPEDLKVGMIIKLQDSQTVCDMENNSDAGMIGRIVEIKPIDKYEDDTVYSYIIAFGGEFYEHNHKLMTNTFWGKPSDHCLVTWEQSIWWSKAHRDTTGNWYPDGADMICAMEGDLTVFELESL